MTDLLSRYRTAYSLPPDYEKGQILLMVVLVMVVVLTVGLSLATRSITNLRQTSEEDHSERALSAAEAGIERAVQTGQGFGGSFQGGTTYQTIIKNAQPTQYTLNRGEVLQRNQGYDVWLANYSTTSGYSSAWSGTLRIAWGTTSACSTAALDIAIISGTATTPIFSHSAYDPCGTTRTTDNFTAPSPGITVNGKTYQYSASLPVITNGILVRITPLYFNTYAAVMTIATNPLPIQDQVIEATGKSNGTERKVILTQTGNNRPTVPLELFPYVLFTPQ